MVSNDDKPQKLLRDQLNSDLLEHTLKQLKKIKIQDLNPKKPASQQELLYLAPLILAARTEMSTLTKKPDELLTTALKRICEVCDVLKYECMREITEDRRK